MNEKKYPYVKITYPGLSEPEYWPYPEALEFCLYLIDEESIIYLTKSELREIERMSRN